jgi:hypothetical protein
MNEVNNKTIFNLCNVFQEVNHVFLTPGVGHTENKKTVKQNTKLHNKTN